MNVIRRTFKRISVMAVTFVILFSMFGGSVVYAKNTSLNISANVYDLKKDSDYVIGGNSPSSSPAVGTLFINGDVSNANKVINSFPVYEVNKGNVTFSYKINQEVLNRTAEEWHLVKDKSKKVNGLTLDSNIMSGALILQTSLDGVRWTEDVLMSDIFANGSDLSNFYETRDIQLQNGCYYRVLIAYKMERQLEDTQILFVKNHNYEYKQVAEVYQFYLFCKTDETRPDATPMKELGSKINTGRDNGYSGYQTIDKNDPHYGWDIGYFYVNGYTRETVTSDQVPVFLKNVGDKVTLWFHLSEDITQLRGNKHLTINEDTNGYDRTFEIDQTNFKHGALIIQYTNSEGEAQTPIIYTDYLAANARTGANTKVQLFEEGDYVVSLDYEIKSMSGPFNLIAKYNNYKIMFKFSIRNGNCMVYPFDRLTGAELADKALTENGFKLDMAKSKYLTIDVQRSILVVGKDGYLTEDVRFNRPAKDGEVYTSEGIYTFNVTNLYTNQHTTKTIYVGSNKYLRALSTTGMSIAELNAEIEKGAKIREDGTIETISTTIKRTPEETQESTESEKTLPTLDDNLDDNKNTYSGKTQEDVVLVDTQEEPQNTNYTPIVIGTIAVVIVISVLVVLKRKKSETIDKGGK